MARLQAQFASDMLQIGLAKTLQNGSDPRAGQSETAKSVGCTNVRYVADVMMVNQNSRERQTRQCGNNCL